MSSPAAGVPLELEGHAVPNNGARRGAERSENMKLENGSGRTESGPSTRIGLWAPKHGAGCSTVAALLGAELAQHGRTLLVDASTAGDLDALCGIAYGSELVRPVAAGLELVRAGIPPIDAGVWRFELVDAGAGAPDETLDALSSCAAVVAVVSNRYLDLRAYCSRVLELEGRGIRPAGAVMLELEGCSLGARDVSSVLERTILARLPFRASIGRAIDAGVLMSRRGELASSCARELAQRLELVPAGVTS